MQLYSEDCLEFTCCDPFWRTYLRKMWLKLNTILQANVVFIPSNTNSILPGCTKWRSYFMSSRELNFSTFRRGGGTRNFLTSQSLYERGSARNNFPIYVTHSRRARNFYKHIEGELRIFQNPWTYIQKERCEIFQVPKLIYGGFGIFPIPTDYI